MKTPHELRVAMELNAAEITELKLQLSENAYIIEEYPIMKECGFTIAKDQRALRSKIKELQYLQLWLMSHLEQMGEEL
ncbi:hypothetical protein [Desulforamulus aquiferis]|uniref:DUF465 domain-containing protein n=1 Tax=Desulforamulus aquiferis TaxID=1397668 RepID=A0AAW7ZBM7_9FIRM|nr:hypothetical protein [Desulforamulus aquiferis]MDO7787103.1 hypothetical protein [Desulforamulus aquiferis]